MTAPFAHAPRCADAPVRPDIAAFADTLDDTDELYWPALAASDGCEASLAELNEMLVEMDCEPFAAAHQRSTWGLT